MATVTFEITLEDATIGGDPKTGEELFELAKDGMAVRNRSYNGWQPNPAYDPEQPDTHDPEDPNNDTTANPSQITYTKESNLYDMLLSWLFGELGAYLESTVVVPAKGQAEQLRDDFGAGVRDAGKVKIKKK